MSFSFNFDVNVEKNKSSDQDTIQTMVKAKDDHSTDARDVADGTEQRVKEAKEHRPPPNHQSLLEDSVCETYSLGSLPPLRYHNESVLEQTAAERVDSEKILTQTVALHSDLISRIYEGGLKIWECTYDFLEYVESEGVTFAGKRVLDLGCGAGLLGITALKMGAREVHFQDYNSTVIEQLTLPNVLLNCDDEDDKQEEEDGDGSPLPKRTKDASEESDLAKCRFYSGDWTSFLPLMLSGDPPPKYDLILTSETIYNTAYYPALHEVFHKLLAQDGLVYLATKAHYFGVGGGLLLFRNFVEKEAVFQLENLKDVEQGLQRHVVALSFNKRD